MQDTERCWNWKNESLDIAGTLAARGWSYNGYPVSADYFGSYSSLGKSCIQLSDASDRPNRSCGTVWQASRLCIKCRDARDEWSVSLGLMAWLVRSGRFITPGTQCASCRFGQWTACNANVLTTLQVVWWSCGPGSESQWRCWQLRIHGRCRQIQRPVRRNGAKSVWVLSLQLDWHLAFVYRSTGGSFLRLLLHQQPVCWVACKVRWSGHVAICCLLSFEVGCSLWDLFCRWDEYETAIRALLLYKIGADVEKARGWNGPAPKLEKGRRLPFTSRILITKAA